MAVNQHPVLQCPTNDPQTGRGAHLKQTEDRVKKNRREKTKRSCERHHLERISRLFKVASSEQTWTRVDVLIFGMVVYLSVGSTDYSPNSLQLLRSSSTVQVPFRPVSSGSSPLREGRKYSRDRNRLAFLSFIRTSSYLRFSRRPRSCLAPRGIEQSTCYWFELSECQARLTRVREMNCGPNRLMRREMR